MSKKIPLYWFKKNSSEFVIDTTLKSIFSLTDLPLGDLYFFELVLVEQVSIGSGVFRYDRYCFYFSVDPGDAFAGAPVFNFKNTSIRFVMEKQELKVSVSSGTFKSFNSSLYLLGVNFVNAG